MINEQIQINLIVLSFNYRVLTIFVWDSELIKLKRH
jgi:hypothetical protein